MAKDRSGYVGKDKSGKWFAKGKVTDSTGKRRKIARRAKGKTQAKQILKAILLQLESEGEKAVESSQMTLNGLCDTYGMQAVLQALSEQ